MNIKRKLSLLQRLTDELDQHIWEVFKKYIMLKHINFNSPDSWTMAWDHIHFKGYDGCRGCYDAACEDIPIEWFIDYDAELQKYKQELYEKDEERKRKIVEVAELSKSIQEARDKSEYERLKKKFLNTNL